MENLKSIVAGIVITTVMGLSGYWAFSTLDSESAQTNKPEKVATEEALDELALETPVGDSLPAQEVAEAPIPKKETPKVSTPLKHQTLISELQKLIDKKIVLQLKSQGTAIGTVQKFINIYNKTEKRIDNDYGATTKNNVATFQKDVGLPQTGETNNDTYQKMIDWLKKQ